MISLRSRKPTPAARPLSNRAIALGAVIVLGIGAAAFTVLLWRYGGLDAIRTASAITVAAGGAAALLLAARRQQSTERTLEHERENTAEQRITELYTRAVDQLGAEDAPVRLGGLHALERVAQSNPTQRQTMVDVICAYLRMPYTPPDEQAPGEDAHSSYEQRRQELQVRLTAQRILTAHLKPEATEAFWDDIDLNLTEAHLHQLDLSACRVRSAQFDGATFTGTAWFIGATFTGTAWFIGATFTGTVRFDGAEFAGKVGFSGATFAETVRFDGAEFAGPNIGFSMATFAGSTWFHKATFADTAWFVRVEFTGTVGFSEAMFVGDARFDGARVAQPRHVVLPMGWTTRAAQPAEGEEEGWLYVVRDEDLSEQLPIEAPG